MAEAKSIANYAIEPYGVGWIIADYSGRRGLHGAAYRGRSDYWESQPRVRDPFVLEQDARKVVRELEAAHA